MFWRAHIRSRPWGAAILPQLVNGLFFCFGTRDLLARCNLMVTAQCHGRMQGHRMRMSLQAPSTGPIQCPTAPQQRWTCSCVVCLEYRNDVCAGSQVVLDVEGVHIREGLCWKMIWLTSKSPVHYLLDDSVGMPPWQAKFVSHILQPRWGTQVHACIACMPSKQFQGCNPAGFLCWSMVPA